MTNKFFLIRVSLAEGTREVSDMSDSHAAEKIAEFSAMLYAHHTQGPMKPMSAGHVIDNTSDGTAALLMLRGALSE